MIYIAKQSISELTIDIAKVLYISVKWEYLKNPFE